MPKAAPIQTSFNAGEVAPRLEGRVDLTKYANACQILQNMLPQVQGPAMKRSGTRFVLGAKSNSTASRMIPFEFNIEQAYTIEVSDGFMRFFRDGGVIVAPTTTFVDGDVTVADDEIDYGEAHYYVDEQGPFRLTTTGVLPAGLELLTSYYIKLVDSEEIQLSLTAGGAAVTITGAAGGGTHTLTAYNDTPHLLVSPYSTANLPGLNWAQSADTLYITHPSHGQRKLTRTGHTAWTLSVMSFDWLPFAPQNRDTALTMFSDVATGAATVTAAGGTPFTAGHVGSYIKFTEAIGTGDVQEWVANNGLPDNAGNPLGINGQCHYDGKVYELTDLDGKTETHYSPPVHEEGTHTDGKWDWKYIHRGSGYFRIDAFTSTTVVTGTVIKELPASVVGGGDNVTSKWAFGAWSALNGYPRTVTFYEDRLWWGGSAGNPQTLWASRTGDYENHETSDEAESALLYTLNTSKINVIEWISAGSVLAVGTAGGEHVLRASSADEALTPSNIKAQPQSYYGSRETLPPMRIENVVLFVQRSGKKLREFTYDFDTDSYLAPDLTILADHITQAKIKEVAYQQEPNRLLWCALEDGSLVCMTYERSQEVVGWHEHVIGGTDTFVESVAVIPNTAGDADQLWLVVRRTIDGGTVRYIEILEPEWEDTNDIEDAFFVDSGLTYDSTPETSFTGLDHLEGETVKILADGAVVPDQVVSSGAITLDSAASVVQAGLAFTAVLQTMRFEAGAADGTAQGKIKRFPHVKLRLYQTGPGLLYGSENVEADMDELFLRDTLDAMDTPVDLFDGDTEELRWPEGYERAGRITLRHRLPYPCMVTAIMPQLDTQDG